MIFLEGFDQVRIRIFAVMVIFLILSLNGVCQDSLKVLKDQTEEKFSWGFSTDINSKFLLRGVSINDGLVLQPDLNASYGNFTAGIWSNITIYDRHHDLKDIELDPYVSYVWPIGNFQIENSMIVYNCVGQQVSPTTAEMFLGVSYPIGDFMLNTIIAADFISYFGSLYIEHGLFYEKQLNDQFIFGSSAVLGWGNAKFNDSFIGTTKTSLNLFSLNAELTYSPKGVIYFKPHFQLGRTINSEISSHLGKYPWFCGLMVGFQL